MVKMIKLNGSTLVETMVASILFILVFISGLESLVRIFASSFSTVSYINIENSKKRILIDCQRGVYSIGETIKEDNRLKVKVRLTQYRSFRNLLDVKIEYDVKGKKLEYRHILKNEKFGL